MREKLIKQTHKSGKGKQPLFNLLGFFIYLLAISATAVFLVRYKVVPWPFHGAETVLGTYGRIFVYLPFAVLALFSLFWVKGAGAPVWENVQWSRFHISFPMGFALSTGYALFLFLSTDFELKGFPFVPPALILSVLNAVAEEVVFRLVLFQLLIMLTGSVSLANGLQACFYGLPHLFIGGSLFFLYAVIYGLVLGWMTRKNNSILPAIICHFVIDIGAIGLPLLIRY